MSKSSATAKQNLARIRDNQRRSRARRKEYLHDLEAKYRHCEQVGAEASAEIQAAARRVVEENKRLRALLHEKGLSDQEIAALTNQNASGDQGLSDSPQPSQPQGAVLESMLSQRKACRPETGCCPPSSNKNTLNTASTPNATTTPPSAPPKIAQKTPSIPSATLYPHNTYIASSAPPSMASYPQAYVYSQPLQPESATPTSMTSSSADVSVGIATPNTSEFPEIPDVPAEDPYIMSYQPDPTQNHHANHQHHPQTTEAYHHMDRFTWGPPSHMDVNAIHVTQALGDNTSSCIFAANVIRSMRSDVGAELEQDLGCCSPNQDCKVDNTTVFAVMDKYTTRPMG